MFGEDEYDEEEAGAEDQEEEGAAAVGINDMYEPAVIQEFFLSDKDVAVRNLDIPERLQLDMAGREIADNDLAFVRAEAKWMVKSADIKWKNYLHIRDSGEDIVQMVNPKADKDDEEDKQYLHVSRTERARLLKESLVEKVTNVLCFFKGVTNNDIQHGGTFIVSKDDKVSGVPNWWQAEAPDNQNECPIGDDEEIAKIRAYFDIPFIQHYRKEYYEPDVRASDLWSIYDLDAKYCSLLTRQMQLKSMFHDKGDDEGVQLCQTLDTEEGLADIKALLELKHPSVTGVETTSKGRKMPVRVSRHKVCMDAGLGKLTKMVCITPKQLCQNLEGAKKNLPKDPSEEPVEFACDYVVEAEKYGFREASTVLEGARQMAAKELAAEPTLRRFVRECYFQPYATVTCEITSKGKHTSEEYHREYGNWVLTPLREINDESFLWIVKALKEGLLDVKVRMVAEREQELLDELYRFYRSDNHNPCAEAWNVERRKIIVEALDILYKVLEQNVFDSQITKARNTIGVALTESVEALLRVPPYVGSPGPDSKRVKPERIMACCFNTPAEFVVIDKFGEVLGFKSIHLRVSRNHNNLTADFSDSELKSLRSFFDEQSPDVVVLGGDGLICRSLHTQLTRACDRFHTEGILKKSIDVFLADQRVAYKYAHSSRGLAEFPRYTPTRLMAVSLARRLQDPLRELSGLCAGITYQK